MKQVLKSLLILFTLTTIAGLRVAHAAKPVDSTDDDARAALSALYAKDPAARALGEKAKGILVFPQLEKVAVLVGVLGGNGAMFADGKIAGHYRADGLLAGLEAGGQTFAYAVFLMSDKALDNLRKTKGFEIGADPNIVVVNAGVGAQITTSTTQADVYSYVFNQSGLMAGVALQGLKITPLDR